MDRLDDPEPRRERFVSPARSHSRCARRPPHSASPVAPEDRASHGAARCWEAAPPISGETSHVQGLL